MIKPVRHLAASIQIPQIQAEIDRIVINWSSVTNTGGSSHCIWLLQIPATCPAPTARTTQLPGKVYGIRRYLCFYYGHRRLQYVQFSICYTHNTSLGQTLQRRNRHRQPMGALLDSGNQTCPLLHVHQSVVYFSFRINNFFSAAALILMAFKYLNSSEDLGQTKLSVSIPY